MPHNMWADYPFPLISTPAVSGGDYKDQFVKSSSKMALMHNVIIRGMNAIYLQARDVTPHTAHDFLMFCRCWCEVLHNHHHCEEAAYFPIIEKACGIDGISDSNVDQHEAFTPGLLAFEAHVSNVHPQDYNSTQIIALLDSFAATLQLHLTDEVIWILSLSRFPSLDLAAIDAHHGSYVRARSSMTRLLPYILTNHDLTYEDGIHAWWFSNPPLRDWFLRYVCTLWHHGAWRYSSCARSGRPKRLYGVDRGRRDALDAGAHAMVELPPALPAKAYTRSESDAEEEGAPSPVSSLGPLVMPHAK